MIDADEPVTVAGIVEASGVSRATLYRRWPSSQPRHGHQPEDLAPSTRRRDTFNPDQQTLVETTVSHLTTTADRDRLVTRGT
ncbi:helix-turn-helix domain containing protein [Rhodococcus sp. T2V]|nr:helix-turn-helix domain containing protein [Rhodococcus sp. T2V]MDF3312926.1 helix-turn-helix domain containing protein [Rhodococcus sp. T2V]